MIKTPDVVNLDKSHVSFCGKAFRFRQEIERSLHETKSEISWNREAWVHETKSEFVEGRGRALHEIESEFVGERGKRAHETKSELVEKMEEMLHETESEFGESRGKALHEIMSEFVGLRETSSPSLPARSPSDSRGEGGATFLAAAKKAVPEKKKVSDTSRILLYEN